MRYVVLTAVIGGSAAVVYGARRLIRRLRQAPADDAIDELIAAHGVKRDGERRRFTGYDVETQKRAVRRKIVQLQESLGEAPKAHAVPDGLRRVV